MAVHADLDVRVEKLPAKDEAVANPENLALLYQGLFTGIVRLQTRRQELPDAESFRRRTIATLDDIEHAARSGGYDSRDISDTHFAVVAFLDSVILNSNDRVRAEWERKPLQEELFGKADAGVVFFERLHNLNSRRDSAELADILEVYLLCLLLGFQGRYSGALRGELDVIEDRLQSRIEGIRGRRSEISPCGRLPGELMPVTVASARPSSLRPYVVAAVASAAITVICFLFFYSDLASLSEFVRARLPD